MIFWNIFSFTIGDQKKLLNKKNACLYAHPHCHSSFLNLKALCILIVVRQKDRQVREHPCHSHTQRTTSKKVNREVISRCKTSARCKSQRNKGKKSTNRNSTSEIFELDWEPVGAQIIAAADQHVAVYFFVDLPFNRDESRRSPFAVK